MTTQSDGNRWCILRTSASRTLALANSLAKASIEVWTPRETKNWRRPRSRVEMEREVPIMPSFVFVRATALPDILRVLALPISPHPQFSIFQYAGRVPKIADSSVNDLRAIEDECRQTLENKRAAAQRRAEVEQQKQARKVKRDDLSVGAPAGVVEDKAWTGVTGVIEATDGRDAWIRFGNVTIKVDAWHVLPGGVTAVAEAA